MQQITPRMTFIPLLEQDYVRAMAWVTGSSAYPRLSGLVKFFETSYNGVLVESAPSGFVD